MRFDSLRLLNERKHPSRHTTRWLSEERSDASKRGDVQARFDSLRSLNERKHPSRHTTRPLSEERSDESKRGDVQARFDSLRSLNERGGTGSLDERDEREGSGIMRAPGPTRWSFG